MIDTRVEFCGLELKNPIVAAASGTTATVGRIKRAEECGAGAVVTKMILLEPVPSQPRFYWDPEHRYFNTQGDKRLNINQGIALVKGAKKEVKIPVIANIMGPGQDLEGWGKLAKEIEAAGADALELNLSCPTIGFEGKAFEIKGRPIPLGAAIGQSPELAGLVTRAVKSATKIPVIAKMTPLAPNMVAVAMACLDAGATAISAINAYGGIPGVDIYHDGRPLFFGIRNQQFGAALGPMMKCMSLRVVAEMNLKIPGIQVAGGGGLYSWQDVVQMIMCGAQVPTLCSAIFFNGWEFVTAVKRGLEKYMEQMGYQTIADFRGRALKYLVTPDKIQFVDQQPVVDEGLCSGCGTCANLAYCDAISMKDNLPSVNEKECLGCSLCTFLCPQEALSMKETNKI